MDLFFQQFQLLRPVWLLMLLPLFVFTWLFWSKKLFSRDWESVIDPRLLPHLLVGKKGKKSIWPILFWLTLGLLIIISLAGPVWKKLPLPVFKQQSALVVILDLSRSMNAADVKPSRLVRARLKLLDLLKKRQEGQTALIAFAATAYTVSPLTDDTDTIQSLVASLTPDIMPVQGSRADLAVEKALELFNNAGISQGDMLLISDGVNQKSINNIEKLNLTNYRLSVLAVGTGQGAPIPAQAGGFVKDNKGSIVIAKTDEQVLRDVASRFGGLYNALSIDESDLNRYLKLLDGPRMLNDNEQTDFKADRWYEEGPWILLLVTPLIALVFRRGIFLTLLLALLLLPIPQPVMAVDLASSWPDWNSWWKNPNQRAAEALQQGDAGSAAELFNRADWKAASHYKAEQYEQALEQLETLDSSDAKYNQANTLAKMGKLKEALDSYDEVLKLQPEHEDALFNRKLVEDALKQQQQKQQQQDQQNQDGEKNNDDQQNSDQKNQDQQDSNQQDSSQQQQDQQQSEQDNNENSKQQSEAQRQQQEQAEQEKQRQEEQSQQAEKNEDAETQEMTEQKTESLSEQAEAQWLRRIPDDPGGLLRNKFKYQYSRQQQPSQEKESW